jgi:tetrahydromethanopterin S-methyltransferase subunit B
MNYTKIKEDESFVRDDSTNAILNVDVDSLTKYRKQREKREKMNEDIENLKAKMDTIENLLQQLVNRENDK